MEERKELIDKMDLLAIFDPDCFLSSRQVCVNNPREFIYFPIFHKSVDKIWKFRFPIPLKDLPQILLFMMVPILV